MRIRFYKSTHEQLDEAIDTYTSSKIKDFILSKDEYIQLLEELDDRSRLLVSHGRTYRGITLLVQ